MISPLAYVSPDAQVGKDVEIGPFAVIHPNVIIGDGCRIGSNATICEYTQLGKNCQVFPSAVIGAIPQDLKFKGEESWAIIGDNCVLREFVTIHRGTASKGKTVVGNDNLIMAYCHIAHDCILGSNIIMSNVTQLAGEVEIDDFAIIGGGTLVHQFSHIGSHVMIQGGSKVNKDIPPFAIVAREPIAFCGINSVGLNRRGFTPEQIHTIQEVYRLLYNNGMNTTQALAHIEATMPQTPERDIIVSFVRASSRGIVKA
ncbi:MAG: acyl-ACP--UDP-N-acetylglucosamine O-acyltransferase [Paludibacteraceae bacterium]|nr:acyl-ACP--UDP-N-acetylglucosamine O-acyltransferase [Paludibacteraceae bacterium]MBQ6983525.1 acyl-ACP--UDP-N-acetylglucosamine O-acyltransferase [Paludibacteraceae bacterium]